MPRDDKIRITQEGLTVKAIPNDPLEFFLGVRKRAESYNECQLPLHKYRKFLQEIIDTRVKNSFNASVRSRKTEFILGMIKAIERLEDEEKRI
jgi:hypothetical protein